MRSSPLRRSNRRPFCYLFAFALGALMFFASKPACADFYIIRSGCVDNVPLAPGQPWTGVHILKSNGPVAIRSTPFSDAPAGSPWDTGFFRACNSGSVPVVITPITPYLASLTSAPTAQWIAESQDSHNSVLYCIPFVVSVPTIGVASMKFSWAADNRIGDPATGANLSGVYLNEQSCDISGGDFKTETTQKRDVTALVRPGGNALYIYQRNTGGVCAVIFSAIIQICPVTNVSNTVVVESGTGSPSQGSDQRCLPGPALVPLRNAAFTLFDFSQCTQGTIPTTLWTGPPGVSPTAKWLTWLLPLQLSGSPSALVRAQFYVPLATVSSATMTIGCTGDDRLGDPPGGPNPNGVFINGVGVAPPITAATPTALVTATRSVTLKPGFNNLYIYTRSTATRLTGTIFSATFSYTGNPCVIVPDMVPPDVDDSYSDDCSSLRIVFNREVTVSSAQDPANYSVSSGTVTNASLSNDGRAAILNVSGWAEGTLQSVQVSNIVSADTALAMTTTETRSFIAGERSVANIQAPDIAALNGPSCADRSIYAGPDDTPGERVTVRGVCIGSALDCYGLEDSPGTFRGGILVSGSSVPLTVGSRYLISGHIMESEGETILTDVANVTETGPGPAPTAILRPVSVLRRTTCDVVQTQESGEDYEGMLVRVSSAVVTRGISGSSFAIRDNAGPPADTLQVCGIDPSSGVQVPEGSKIDVTGLLVFRDGQFKIAPRDNDDIRIGRSPELPPQRRPTIAVSAYPNPFNPETTISFSLSRGGPVNLAIYDVTGRLIRSLVHKSLAPGSYSQLWNSRDDSGRDVSSGVYFFRLVTEDFKETRKIVLVK